MKYETVIGLEVHVQLNTRSKAFCGDATDFGASPNSQVSPISLAHPGTLPRMNTRQIDSAIKLGLALGSQFPEEIRFDRKNYFYTDLPKGYQITQDAKPICQGGSLPIRLKEGYRDIRIHHVHMEEDAGKSIHDQKEAHSLVDLNRAGVPLLEIVTEPDLRSGAEVDAFMTAVRQLVRYLDISDGHMEQGSLRCDVNVSVRLKGESVYGERCEIKNLNSMKFARQAIKHEFKRQTELLENGQKVSSQTRQFHPENGTTSPLRSKEDAPDYRYFPEPDMPPVPLEMEKIKSLAKEAGTLPWEYYNTFHDTYGLSAEAARILSETKETADHFLRLVQQSENKQKQIAKTGSNILIQHILPRFPLLEGFPLKPAQTAQFCQILVAKIIPTRAAIDVLLPAWIKAPESDPEQLIAELRLNKQTDTDELRRALTAIVQAHPKEKAIYKGGKRNLLGFFMGQALRKVGKHHDPGEVRKLLVELLEA